MKNSILIVGLLYLFITCTGDDAIDIPKNPIQAQLIFPFKNSLCTEGTDKTLYESTIKFEWENDLFTDTYEVFLKNLNTEELTQYKTNATEISIPLQLGTPYEWYIVSSSNSVATTAQSEKWRFYNEGVTIKSYVPFPAEIISPSMAASITSVNDKITLDWNGNDVDNDISGYDVLFGTTTSPDIIENNIKDSTLKEVGVISNTIYYWKIITIDSKGNKSDSGLYQFKVQ